MQVALYALETGTPRLRVEAMVLRRDDGDRLRLVLQLSGELANR